MKRLIIFFFSLISSATFTINAYGQECELLTYSKKNYNLKFDKFKSTFANLLLEYNELDSICVERSLQFLRRNNLSRDQIIELYNLVIDNTRAKTSRHDSILTRLYTSLAYYHKIQNNFTEAFTNFDLAKKYSNKVFDEGDEEFRKIYYNVGETYARKGDNDFAINYIDTALYLYGYDTIVAKKSRFYEELSTCYSKKGDGFLSDSYYDLYKIISDTFKKSNLIIPAIEFANNKFFLEEYPEGLQAVLPHEKILYNPKTKNDLKKDFSNLLYKLHFSNKDFDSAKKFLDIYGSISSTTANKVSFLINQSRILAKKDYDLAINKLKQAIELARKNDIEEDLNTAYINSISYSRKNQNLGLGYELYEKWKEDCHERDIRNSHSFRNIKNIGIITKFIVEFVGDKSDNNKLLEEAYDYIKYYVEESDSLINTYTDHEALIHSIEDRRKLISRGIELCYLLHTRTNDSRYNEEALGLMEKSKSLILLFNAAKNINKDEYSDIEYAEKLKDSIIMGRQILKDEMLPLSQRLEESLVVCRQLRQLRQLYKSSSIPDYVSDNTDVITDRSRNFISYHGSLADDHLFYRIHNFDDELKFDTFHLDHKEINQIYDLYSAEKTEKRIQVDISTLSTKLLPESVPTEFLVIPDNILAYIPFDVLDYKGKYLIHHSQISYSFSLSHLKELLKSQKKHSHFIGFAPSYNSSGVNSTRTVTYFDSIRSGQELKSLKNNIEEVLGVESNFSDTRLFLREEATKQNFVEQAEEAGILHIAGHATSDYKGIDNYLYFSSSPDYVLDLNEVYGLKISAQMVTLSACETSLGKNLSGEGILSFARGFAYAGAQSVVSTLWSVDDGTTSHIMASFYSYLSEGYEKDAALRQAKLDYIAEARGPGDNEPYYWAGVIVTGDTRALVTPSYKKYYYLLGVGALIFFGFYWMQQKKSVA